jgi:HAD superfamily hydrolase (TIGR01450 family)
MVLQNGMVSEQFDAFLLDLDGVVYLRDEALPEAVESVNRFDKRDKELRFLTNDPRFQCETIANKLRKLEIDAEEDEIITSGWATARYLSQQDVTTAAVVGSEGLEIELQEEGIEVTDDDPNAMVVGADEIRPGLLS